MVVALAVVMRNSVLRTAPSQTQLQLRERVRSLMPKLDAAAYKGQAGRVGVMGGSLEYTGAPFFAAMSALRCGADLSHVFCTTEAGLAIKAMSGDVIVHPYDWSTDGVAGTARWCKALDVLVVGPGLGRSEPALAAARALIRQATDEGRPALVIDGDGRWALRGHDALLLSLAPQTLLTPNRGEFERLTQQLAGRPLRALVVRKGPVDVVGPVDGPPLFACDTAGSPRRCGGQGDLLAGAIAAFLNFAPAEPALMAWAACDLLREASAAAFAKKKRSMVATDVLEELPAALQELYPVE